LANHPESHRLERWVHKTLLAGLIVSALLLATGLTLAFSRDQPRPEGRPPSSASLIRGAFEGDGAAMLYLGLLALMATPVLRVVALALGWGLEGERRFSAVALAVLGMLALGLVIGVG